jgi:hypothetical protein
MTHPSLNDLDAGAGKFCRDILGYRGRDESLLRGSDMGRKVCAALCIQLGKDIVKNQNR